MATAPTSTFNSTYGLIDPSAANIVLFEQIDPNPDPVAAQLVSNSSKKILAVEIDNTFNSADIIYFKMWEAAPTVGTTEPTVILFANAGEKVQYTFDVGFTLSNVYAAALSEPGTSGNKCPTGGVIVKILME